MNRVRSWPLGLTVLVLLGMWLSPSSPASAGGFDRPSRFGAATGSTAPPAAASIPLTVIAVRGSNNRLYAKSSSDRYFRDLGGVLTATPAVGYSSVTHRAYYVVVGTGQALYVRTDSTPFTRLVSSACSYSPAVAVSGSAFAASCVGYDSPALYAGQTTLPGNGANPRLPTMYNQGGTSIAGPAAYFSGGALHLWVIGHLDSTGVFNVYSRAASEPSGSFHGENEACADQLAVTDNHYQSRFYLGCRNGSTAFNGGTANSMYYESRGTHGVDGSIRGTVGVAASADGSAAEFYASGTNGVVYAKLVYPNGQGPFVQVGGRVQPGVAAATIE